MPLMSRERIVKTVRYKKADHIPIDSTVSLLPAEAPMKRLFQAPIETFKCYAGTGYKYVDAIEVCENMGMQNSTWISPQIYPRLIRPYHQSLYHHIKSKIEAPILFYTDGSVSSLISDFIEMGMDIQENLALSTPG